MNWYQNPNDALQHFQSALQQSANQYQNASAQLEEQLRLQQQALQKHQYILQQERIRLAIETQRLQLAALIRSRRMALNMDLSALAHFCNIKPSTLLYIENGNSGNIPFDNILRVMQALGLQLSAFPQA